MDLSIIIPTYNSRRCMPECLRSIRAHAGNLSPQIFVVDNASTDGTADQPALASSPVHYIRNPRNIGFSRACNQGIAASSGEFLLLLNPDTALLSGTLEEMVRYLRTHPDVGILGAKVLNRDGTLQLACRRSIPTLRSAFFRLSGLSRLFPRSRTFGAYNLTFRDENEAMDVEAVSGAFLLIRRELVERIGGLDERFFMFGEDLDWCLRARQAGSRVLYWPQIVIRHLKGESIRSRPFASLYHFHHAMWLFYRKHYYDQNARWENWAAFVGICAAAAVQLTCRAVVCPWRRRRQAP